MENCCSCVILIKLKKRTQIHYTSKVSLRLATILMHTKDIEFMRKFFLFKIGLTDVNCGKSEISLKRGSTSPILSPFRSIIKGNLDPISCFLVIENSSNFSIFFSMLG